MDKSPVTKSGRQDVSGPGVVMGQRSWEFSSDCVDAAVTVAGGQLGPVGFRLGRRVISPYAVAPWAEEDLGGEFPPIIRALRGDFFCMPFGANSSAYRGEQHPLHGEVANNDWKLVSLDESAERSVFHAELETRVRAGRVDKWIELRAGETNIYSHHRVSGMSGRMSFGHHAMLKFPDRDGAGRISTSRILFGQVAPEFEFAEKGGYQSLRPDATFEGLERVPDVFGGFADLSKYPARRGYEDLVMVVHESELDFAWTAVCFPDDGYVWFSLKDPRVLRSTVFWISNGGRHYAPWNGRHVGVLGLEEVTSNFAHGLAESARSNSISRRGYPTSVALKAGVPLDVRTIMGVAEIPKGFNRVKTISRTREGILMTGEGKNVVKVAVDTGFLVGEGA